MILKSVLLIAIVAVAMIGVMVPSIFAEEYTLDQSYCIELDGIWYPSGKFWIVDNNTSKLWDGFACVTNQPFLISTEHTVTIPQGTLLEINHGFVNKGTLINYGTINNDKTFTNDGTINNYGEIFHDSNIFNNYGTINNYNLFNNDDESIFNNEDTFNNNGIFNNIYSAFNNNESSIFNNEDTFNNFYRFNNLGTFNNNGNIHPENNYQSNFIYTSGTFNNNGIIYVHLFHNTGIVNNNEILNNFNLNNQGTINNTGTINNEGANHKCEGGTIENSGTINSDNIFEYCIWQETTVETISEPVVEPIEIASFVDQTKDPQHYIDRYNNEPTYREWFDDNYSQYSSIYEAVGMEKPIVEDIPKPIVEPVVEYSPEPEYSSEPISDEVTINFQIGSQYSLYEMIRIEGEVSKIIPNTPIRYQFSTDVDRFTKSYEMLSPYEPHLDENGKFHMTIEYYECDDCTSGDVHLEFFYGQPDNHLASIKKSFYVDNKISKTSEKIQNYFPTDKYEIGTDVNFRERVPDIISTDPLASYWGSILYESRLNPKISISYFANGDHVPTGKLQNQKSSYGCHSPSLQECQNFNLHDFECVSVSSYSYSSHEICENEYYQIFENYGKKKVNFGETGGFYMNKIIDNIVENPLETDPELQCGSGTTYKDGQCIVDEKEGGGCLIATATYGSEMAPQVQQLRELRDNQLLQTESGTAFMGTFNDIYYSFSPIIADYERENPLFKEAVKLAITPMISTLSLMENANSESEVLSIGISVIMLNIGMYLGVPAIVVVGIRKRF